MTDRRVAMSAACKRARETGEAWVTWNGERLRLVKPPVNESDCFDALAREGKQMTIVYVRRGHFRVAVVGMRKGCYPMIDTSDNGGNMIQLRVVRALVVERHPL